MSTRNDICIRKTQSQICKNNKKLEISKIEISPSSKIQMWTLYFFNEKFWEMFSHLPSSWLLLGPLSNISHIGEMPVII